MEKLLPDPSSMMISSGIQDIKIIIRLLLLVLDYQSPGAKVMWLC